MKLSRTIARFTLAALLYPGMTLMGSAQQTSGCVGVCNSTIVGAAVGIGAAIGGIGILLAVNHDHHFLKGCTSSGPDGVELRTGDSKTYMLQGNSGAIKPGEMIRVHGSKEKKARNSKGDQVFRVDELKKDYGPCRELASASASGTP